MASDEEGITNIYYDKIYLKEQLDKARRTCLCLRSCLPGKKVDDGADDEQQKKKSGPGYGDLRQLLEDFKAECEELQQQLADEGDQVPEDGTENDMDRLLDERIRELRELKALVGDNQECIRDYLGIKGDEEDQQEDAAGVDGQADRADARRRRRKDGDKKIAKSKAHDEKAENQWLDAAKAEQEKVFSAQLDESDRLKKAAVDEFKKKMAEKMGANRLQDEDRDLLHEVESKLSNIDSLIKEEEESQNKLLSDALERRRKRRAALQGKLGGLVDKKDAQEEKIARKLKAAKEQERVQLARLDDEIEQGRKEELESIDTLLKSEHDKKVQKLQKELRAYNKQDPTPKEEHDFSEQLEAYKGKVADLDREMAEEQERQRLALEERLARRRRGRIKDIEDQAAGKETELLNQMQKKSGQAAEELEAVENMLRPVEREGARLDGIAAALRAETAPTINKATGTNNEAGVKSVAGTADAATGTDGSGADAATASLDADPEIAALQAESDKQQEAQDRRVGQVEDQLQEAAERATSEKAAMDRRKQELKDRLANASDEGERRRLMATLGQLDQDWNDRLAQENEAQAKQLKAALEERRRARKKRKDAIAEKRQEKLVHQAEHALDGVLNVDEEEAATAARLLVEKIDEEFAP